MEACLSDGLTSPSHKTCSTKAFVFDGTFYWECLQAGWSLTVKIYCSGEQGGTGWTRLLVCLLAGTNTSFFKKPSHPLCNMDNLICKLIQTNRLVHSISNSSSFIMCQETFRLKSKTFGILFSVYGWRQMRNKLLLSANSLLSTPL